MTGVRQAFVESLGFALDDFQVDALDALDPGSTCSSARPPGRARPLVANYAVHLALESGGRAFYTTPLKALSNQKFHELCAEHGTSRVGLLTGDASINRGAPIVVMTTEVLRNMLLTGSDAARDARRRRPRRGPLPPGPLPRRRLGGGPHPHPAGGALRLPVGDRRQRRDARRVAVRPCAAPSTVVVERTRPIDLHHHVTLVRRGRPAPSSSTCSTAAPRATRGAGSTICVRTDAPVPARAAAGRAPARRRPRRRPLAAAQRGARPSRTRTSCRHLLHLLAGRLRGRRAPVRARRAARSPRPRVAREVELDRQERIATSATRTSTRSVGRVARERSSAASPPHHAGLVPSFREVVGAVLRAACSARSSRPRRCRSASTCRHARWSSSGSPSSAARAARR